MLPQIASYIQSINPFTSTHSVHFGKLDIQSLLELEPYDYYRVAQLIEELQPVLEAEEENDKALSRHPIGYLGEPDDIAYAVLYLASDESKFVTGSEFVIDGGYLAR